MMHTKETRHMKPPYSIFQFLVVCVLTMSLLTIPTAQAAESNAVEAINDAVNSNEGGTMVSLTNQIAGDVLDRSATDLHGAAWKGNKMGASSTATGSLLERRDSLKGASNILSTGGVLIDHAGYASTAAGEIAGGSYAQGFITIADGLGKSVVSGIGSAIGATVGAVTGSGLGSVVGPAGTIYGGAAGGYAGGAAGGYAASQVWDNSVAKLASAIKTGLDKQDDKRQFREQSGPLMLGMTSEEIHEKWIKYKKELDDKKKQAVKSVKEKEKEKVVPSIKPQTVVKVKEEKVVPPVKPQSVEKDDGRFIAYENGTVLDTRTGLMWAAKDNASDKNWDKGKSYYENYRNNGTNLNWASAKSYCENYRGGGYTDWRMPTLEELAGLYDASKGYQYFPDEASKAYEVHLTPLIRLSSHVPWASNTRAGKDAPEAAYFYFNIGGGRDWEAQSRDENMRALPVRTVK